MEDNLGTATLWNSNRATLTGVGDTILVVSRGAGVVVASGAHVTLEFNIEFESLGSGGLVREDRQVGCSVRVTNTHVHGSEVTDIQGRGTPGASLLCAVSHRVDVVLSSGRLALPVEVRRLVGVSELLDRARGELKRKGFTLGTLTYVSRSCMN